MLGKDREYKVDFFPYQKLILTQTKKANKTAQCPEI